MKKNMKMIVSLAMVGMLALTACGWNKNVPEDTSKETSSTQEDTGTEDKKGTDYKVGYVMLESTGNAYNQLKAIQRECETRGWELMYDSADKDSAKTISLTNDFITRGCDAIYVYTVDAGTQATVKEICDKANVHVAFTGLMEEGCVEICDNEATQGKVGAETLTKAAAEKWGGDAKADLIICTEATEVGDGNRIRMHENLIPELCRAQDYNEEDVVWVDCALDLMTATSQVSNALSAHPDAKHILIPVFYDASGGQGAMNALKAAGRDEAALIVSYHISDEVTTNAIENEPCWYGSFYFPPESYTGPLFECLDKWAVGENVEEGFQYSQYVLVTADNINEMTFEFAQ